MNILIVDDISANIFSLKSLIENDFRITIFSAQNVQEAIQILMKNNINLILTDIQMPEIDGFEFAEILRTNQTTKNIPIIFITAIYESEKYKTKGYNLGALDYITKPIDGNILKLKLSKYIDIFESRDILEKENKHIKELLNIPEVGYILTNPNIENNPVILVNDYFCEFTGYTKDEIIGKNLDILKADNSDEKEREQIKNALKEKIPITVILKNKKKNGDIYYNKLSISPIFDQISKKLKFFLGVQNNVTDVVKESKFLKTVLNTSQAIILVINQQNLIKINNKFFDLFEYNNLEHFKSSHDCICELFIKKENCLQPIVNELRWNEFVIANPSTIHKAAMIDKNGNERIFQVESSGKFIDNDNEEEVITFTDITELENKNKLLINQSRQVAMGEMMNLLAHQWRQPLATVAAIISKIQVKQDLELLTKEDLNNNIKNISSVVKHLSKTINLFQNYFKEKNGKKISIIDLHNNINVITAPIWEKNEIRNEFECLEDYMIDDRLDHVFLNIYQNASDALIENKNITDKYISTKILKNKENQIEISISDNAGGIPQNIINKIFEPYFSTKSKNGTGLGLYMTKKIVEDYIGGTLTVKNEENGACFKIVLPL